MKKLLIILSSVAACLVMSTAYAGPVIETISTHASLWIENMDSTDIPEPAQFLVALSGLVGLVAIRRKKASV